VRQKGPFKRMVAALANRGQASYVSQYPPPASPPPGRPLKNHSPSRLQESHVLSNRLGLFYRTWITFIRVKFEPRGGLANDPPSHSGPTDLGGGCSRRIRRRRLRSIGAVSDFPPDPWPWLGKSLYPRPRSLLAHLHRGHFSAFTGLHSSLAGPILCFDPIHRALFMGSLQFVLVDT
jgi:hypothetical protein